MKPRLYLETTIVSYLVARPSRNATIREILENVEVICAKHGSKCPIVCTPDELMGLNAL